MITCGIDLAGGNAFFVVLRKDGGIISDITGKFNKLSINDDENCKEVRSFHEAIRMLFDSFSPDRIGVIKRAKLGKFAGGAVSFKIEGLIQLYERKVIHLVSPHTLRSFMNKKTPDFNPKYKYQKEAYLLALYLLEA
jgi:hypothetical protein